VQQHAHWAGIPYDFMAIEGAGHLIDFFTLYPGHYLTALDRIVNLFYVFMATPTPVELGHFELTPEHERVIIRWRTLEERDHAGFNVNRSTAGTGAYERLNAGLLRGGAVEADARAYRFVDECVEPGERYEYLLEAVDLRGGVERFGLGTVHVPARTAIVGLEQPVLPSPFRPGDPIRFELASPRHVRLSIHDVQGRLLRVLVDEHRNTGALSVPWDARNAAGGRLSSGVYLYRLRVGGDERIGKIVLIVGDAR
jgi:hypothetical protein